MVMVALCGIATAQVVKSPVVTNWNVVRLDSLENDTTTWQSGQTFAVTYLVRYAVVDTLAGLPRLMTTITYQYLFNNATTRSLDTVTVLDTLSAAADSLEAPYLYTVIPASWRWRVITYSTRAKTMLHKQTFNWR
jgi:hypothetical protein